MDIVNMEIFKIQIVKYWYKSCACFYFYKKPFFENMNLSASPPFIPKHFIFIQTLKIITN